MAKVSAVSTVVILLLVVMFVASKQLNVAFVLLVIGSVTAAPFTARFSGKDYRALFLISCIWMLGAWVLGHFGGGLAAMTLGTVPWTINRIAKHLARSNKVGGR